MITAPMSWIHALEQFVPTGSLSKGRNYFRSGAVQIEKASEDRLEATVKGGGWYSVVLYLDMGEETVVASCTCPHYEDINLCKHIWATVLAAESKGYLRQIAKIGNPSIETEIEYEGLDSDVGDFVSDLQCFPVPTHSGPVVRTVALNGPILDVTRVVLYIHINSNVGICPLEFRHSRLRCNRKDCQVIRNARPVMCEDRTGNGDDSHNQHDRGEQSVFHTRSPKSKYGFDFRIFLRYVLHRPYPCDAHP